MMKSRSPRPPRLLASRMKACHWRFGLTKLSAKDFLEKARRSRAGGSPPALTSAAGGGGRGGDFQPDLVKSVAVPGNEDAPQERSFRQGGRFPDDVRSRND